jgi:hypothetical protein
MKGPKFSVFPESAVDKHHPPPPGILKEMHDGERLPRQCTGSSTHGNGGAFRSVEYMKSYMPTKYVPRGKE